MRVTNCSVVGDVSSCAINDQTWPLERFSRVAMRLLDPEGPMKGGRLMVLGGPEDAKLAKGLRDVVMRSQFQSAGFLRNRAGLSAFPRT